MTIEKVKQLSKKGDKLSWEDFQFYNCTEIGSGLSIKVYPIDDKYSILIGSAGPKEPLRYIYLENHYDGEKRIDIRYDDIDKFTTIYCDRTKAKKIQRGNLIKSLTILNL